MNKDQVKGKVNQAKGDIKKTTGKILGDKSMENKGNIQKTAGIIQENYGNLKQDLKNNN